MFLIDTNVVSELRKTRPHGAVLAWVRSVAEPSLRVSVVTLFEMQAGAEQTRETDLTKALEIDSYIDRCTSMFRILDVDVTIARRWAKLMHKRQVGLSGDAMIAATALVNSLTVVTRDTRDFVPFGVATLDPFKG